MKLMRLLVFPVLLLALVSAGCAPTVSAPAPFFISGQVGSPQPTLQPFVFPRGRFSAVTAPNMVLLSIENDGSFRIFLDNALLDSGRFEVSGTQVLVDSVVCEREGERAAAYDWFYDDEIGLAFQPAVSDPCPERQQYLSEQYVPKYLFVLIPDRTWPPDWMW